MQDTLYHLRACACTEKKKVPIAIPPFLILQNPIMAPRSLVGRGLLLQALCRGTALSSPIRLFHTANSSWLTSITDLQSLSFSTETLPEYRRLWCLGWWYHWAVRLWFFFGLFGPFSSLFSRPVGLKVCSASTSPGIANYQTPLQTEGILLWEMVPPCLITNYPCDSKALLKFENQ